MTSPADDCGVTGGCQACPLFAANVCGDPAPEQTIYDTVALAVDAVGDRAPDPERFREAAEIIREVAALDDSAQVEAHLDGLDCGQRPCGTCAPAPTPVCVQTPSGRVRCGSTELETAPDRDPAEPRPDGVGCCGGSCSV